MIKRPRGVYDLIENVSYYNYISNTIKSVLNNYGVQEIKLPMFEFLELYKRGTGETTDIVNKEIYTFTDRKQREFALRPEGTAGVMRSYIENKLYGDYSKTTKQFYIGEFFRYERPQFGRQRQFNQFGVEYINIKDNNAIVEVFLQISELLKQLNLSDLKFTINNLGTIEEREDYKKNLVQYLSNYKENLCDDCITRLEKNPLRILDCKIDSKQDFVINAPKISTFYKEESLQNYNELKYLLDELNINYKIDETMVRGLDYYSNIVFEVEANNITLLGGGCYDGLFEQLGGGRRINSLGYAIGVERLVNILIENDFDVKNDKKTVYILDKVLTMESKIKLNKLSIKLRENNINVEYDLLSKSKKALFKYSEKVQGTVITIDENNIDTENINLYENGKNVSMNIDTLVKKVKNV